MLLLLTKMLKGTSLRSCLNWDPNYQRSQPAGIKQRDARADVLRAQWYNIMLLILRQEGSQWRRHTGRRESGEGEIRRDHKDRLRQSFNYNKKSLNSTSSRVLVKLGEWCLLRCLKITMLLRKEQRQTQENNLKGVPEKNNRGEDQGGRSEMEEAAVEGWACCLMKLKQEEGEGGWKGIRRLWLQAEKTSY